MKAVERVGEEWASLVGVVADRDHIVKLLLYEAVDGLGALPADVDPLLGHDLDGERMELARLRPGAYSLDVTSPDVAQEALRHLTAGRVVSADEEKS